MTHHRKAWLLLLVCWFAGVATAGQPICTFVIDGDTVVVSGVGKVRLIGVDAPEVAHEDRPGEPGGEEATQYLRELVEGQPVRLEYDWERYDKFGRTLAYVYLLNATMVNEALIRSGHAEPMHHFSYKYKARFKEIAGQR